MPVAAIICCRDRPLLLEGALEAVARATRPDDEIVVVDSASRHDGVRAAARNAGATVVRCERPGVSRARNAGAAASSSPLLAFTDDDCRPSADWLATIDSVFVGDDALGLLTGSVHPDRPTGRAVSVVLDANPRPLGAGDDPAAVGAGANMAVRRAAFEAVGGFDERMGPGARYPAAEDHDLFWRMLATGWDGRYDPRVTVVHEQWRTLGQLLTTSYRYGVGSGALVAKARRIDPASGRRLLGRRLWDDGLRRSAEHLRRHYEVGAACALVTALGVASGALRAWRAPLQGAVFARGPD